MSGPFDASTDRFFDRMSARVIFQLFSAVVSATFCWASAWLRVVSDWRYCQIDVAISPATPITKLDRNVWYRMMKRPSLDVSSAAGFAGSGGAMSMRRSNPSRVRVGAPDGARLLREFRDPPVRFPLVGGQEMTTLG